MLNYVIICRVPKYILFYSICLDIDECILNTHSCHSNATCSNTVGNFTCVCNAGWSGDGYSCSGERGGLVEGRSMEGGTGGGGRRACTTVDKVLLMWGGRGGHFQ